LIGNADKRAVNLAASYWALNARRGINVRLADTEWWLKDVAIERVNRCHGQDRAAD
jgi:hypothetical protein